MSGPWFAQQPVCPAGRTFERSLRGTETAKIRVYSLFARFARIAKGSLHESMNHLIDAKDQRLITDDELLIEEHHIKKAISAVTGLIRHLERTREPALRTKNPTESNS